MLILADLHCHTVASSHGYSTIKEYAEDAAAKGLEAVAITDHAPGVTDGAHPYHFQSLHKIVPRVMCGVVILRGAECTFQNSGAELDLNDYALGVLDLVIASIHQSQYAPSSAEEHTKLLLTAAADPRIHILGHIGREQQEFDIAAVVKRAKETGKLIEINAVSVQNGAEVRTRCAEVARACKKYRVPVAVNSDSHICCRVGDVASALQMLEEIGFDEELIVNTSLEKVKNYLNITL
jgi:putative hydrolase